MYFYSKNANKLSFDLHNKIIESKATVILKKVEVNTKNALDFQLSFFAEKLASRNPNCEINIVSQDKGYDCLSDFAAKEEPVILNRVLNLSGYNSSKQKQELQQNVSNALKDVKIDGINKSELINFIVDLILNYKTKSAINNNINKYLKDGAPTKIVYKAIKPLLKDKT
ncbi:MAG: hypothetical protein IKU41_06300 [Clostridia bacterium]|nr:hypothetical protein [Clostridia bacterium]